MSTNPAPLVSVVTPVYNGERYLRECIESVLAQSHQNFEYVIVNNQSKDKTPEIAEEYAKSDSRVRVHHNRDFLDLIPNWNHAMRQISCESKYCKVVHADDTLFPSCLESMVGLAEENPKVGVVGSYRVLGRSPSPAPAVPLSCTVVTGDEVVRATLRAEYSLFGSPSSVMIRSDLVRSRDPFYDEDFLHSDKLVCLDLMRDHDFGFVHEMLTYTRLHDESQTTELDEVGSRGLENLFMLKRLGPEYLPKAESAERIQKAENLCYRFVARKLFSLQGSDSLRFHRAHLRKHGYTFSYGRLATAALMDFADNLLEPKILVSRLGRMLGRLTRSARS